MHSWDLFFPLAIKSMNILLSCGQSAVLFSLYAAHRHKSERGKNKIGYEVLCMKNAVRTVQKRAEDMVQWEKSLLHKQKDLSLNSSTPEQNAGHGSYTSRAGGGRGADRWIPGTLWSSHLAIQWASASVRSPVSKTKVKSHRRGHSISTSGLSTCMHGHIEHTHACAHTIVKYCLFWLKPEETSKNL